MLVLKWGLAGGQSDTIFRGLYGYSPDGDLTNEDILASAATQNLLHIVKHESLYDNQHRKIQTVTNLYNSSIQGLAPKEKRRFIYDNYGLLDTLDHQNWDGNKWTHLPDTSAATSSHIYTFKYEVGWPVSVTGTQDVTNIKLYPSPTSDFIRVETEWQQAIPFTAAIADMHGRIIRQWQEPAAKHYTRTIPLTELSTGMYILKLSCGEEQVAKQFAVIK
jgi:hypothetical protein